MHKDPHRNIALPDSLLSRFDLLFVVTDDVDERRDRMISEHVLRMHRYLQPGLEEGAPALDTLDQALNVGSSDATDPDGAALLGDSSPFEKYNPLLHAGIQPTVGKNKKEKREVLTINFVKKYIQYAKSRIHPLLTQEASEWIVNVYANLRNNELAGNQKKTSPLTARTLETLIRLATAHAKARLSNKVEASDAEAAEEILRFALFKEVVKQRKNKHKKRKIGAGRSSSVDDSDESEDDEEEEEEEDKRMKAPYSGSGAYATRGAVEAGAAPSQTADAHPSGSQHDPNGSATTPPALPASPPNLDPNGEQFGGLDPQRLNRFRSKLSDVLRGPFQEEDSISVDMLLPAINEGEPTSTLFSTAEARQALEIMNNDNDIMFMPDDGKQVCILIALRGDCSHVLLLSYRHGIPHLNLRRHVTCTYVLLDHGDWTRHVYQSEMRLLRMVLQGFCLKNNVHRIINGSLRKSCFGCHEQSFAC